MAPTAEDIVRQLAESWGGYHMECPLCGADETAGIGHDPFCVVLSAKAWVVEHPTGEPVREEDDDGQ